MKAQRSAHARLSLGSDAMPQGPDGILEESLAALGKNLEARALDLERFKQANAVLRNSLSYLPIAAGRLTNSLSSTIGSARLAGDMNWVLRDALVYNLSGDIALRENLRNAVVAVEGAAQGLNEETRSEVDNILSHVAVILTQKPILDRLVANLMGVESVARIDDVIRHYNKVNTFLSMDKTQEAKVEMHNLHMNLYAMMEKYNTKSLSFACLVTEINGNKRDDISDEGLMETVRMLEKTGITYEDLTNTLNESKKKSKPNWKTRIRSIFHRAKAPTITINLSLLRIS